MSIARARRARERRRPAPVEDADQARRRALILEVVENQLRENNPPETNATLQRLVSAGADRDEAMRLIGCVLATEIYDILKDKLEFSLPRYVRRLEALPAMPWETVRS